MNKEQEEKFAKIIEQLMGHLGAMAGAGVDVFGEEKLKDLAIKMAKILDGNSISIILPSTALLLLSLLKETQNIKTFLH